MTQENYKDQLLTRLFNKKWFALIIIFHFGISALGNFLNSIATIKNTTMYVLARFNDSVNRQISYSSETVGHYYSEFEAKVAQYRQEYLKRGIVNKDVNDLYTTPTNPIGIQNIANGLNDLAAQLQVK